VFSDTGILEKIPFTVLHSFLFVWLLLFCSSVGSILRINTNRAHKICFVKEIFSLNEERQEVAVFIVYVNW
jgi:hypothetical protein